MSEAKMSPAFEKMMDLIGQCMDKRFILEQEYFDTLSHINEHLDTQTLVCNNMMKMSMVDQLKILKPMSVISDVCVELQDKYDFEVEDNYEK